MVKESQQYAEEDKKKQELAETKNKADTLVYSTEKAVKDYGEKVSEDDKKKIEEKLSDLKEALKSNDKAKIDSSMEELTKVSHNLAQEMYKQQQTQQQAGQQAGVGPQPGEEQGSTGQEGQAEEEPNKGNGEDVIDADYKEENNK